LSFRHCNGALRVAADGLVRGHAQEQGGRETHAFALIDSALEQARVAREEIDCLAVGIGPGSYTGIRIAIAIAQGWQLARGVKLLGISSADCVGAQAHERGMRGLVNVVFDAQQGEFFVTRYELADRGCTQIETFRLMIDADWKRAEAGEIMIRADAGEKISDAERFILPDAGMAAKLALGRSDFVNAASLEPLYLRKATFVKAAPPRTLIQ
jgi:tRNA threonylcarbamoyl adenosine modification protein YeaZ